MQQTLFLAAEHLSIEESFIATSYQILKVQYSGLIRFLLDIRCCALPNTMKMRNTEDNLCALSSVMQKDRSSTEILIRFPNCFLSFVPLYSCFLLDFSVLMTVTITEMRQVAEIVAFSEVL